MQLILFPYHDSLSNHNFFFQKCEKKTWKNYTLFTKSLYSLQQDNEAPRPPATEPATSTDLVSVCTTRDNLTCLGPQHAFANTATLLQIH